MWNYRKCFQHWMPASSTRACRVRWPRWRGCPSGGHRVCPIGPIELQSFWRQRKLKFTQVSRFVVLLCKYLIGLIEMEFELIWDNTNRQKVGALLIVLNKVFGKKYLNIFVPCENCIRFFDLQIKLSYFFLQNLKLLINNILSKHLKIFKT